MGKLTSISASRRGQSQGPAPLWRGRSARRLLPPRAQTWLTHPPRALCHPSGLLLVLGILFTATAPAQNRIPDLPPVPNRGVPPAAAKKATVATTKEAAPSNLKPSRFIDEDDIAAYIASLSATFSMRERATDPFGQLQDPDAKPVIKATIAKPTRRAAPVQAVPFSDIVRLIKVTTVMPREKRFLMGTRSVQQGEHIALAFRGKTLRVAVTAVSSSQIEFRNLENGETAAMPLNLLPPGMTPGTHSITAPGMVPDRSEAPIELDPGNLPADNSQSR